MKTEINTESGSTTVVHDFKLPSPSILSVKDLSAGSGKENQIRWHLKSKLNHFISGQCSSRHLTGFHALFTKGKNNIHDNDDKKKARTNHIYIPLDIIFDIAKHLDAVDYTILRYACRDYYYMLPPTREPLMADPCGRSLLLSRLVDSNLLPKIYLKHGTLPLTPPLTSEQVKKMLYWERINSCQLCDRLSFDDCFDMCPLHARFDSRPKLPKGRTRLELAFLLFGWSKGFGFRRITTREAYFRFLERLAAATTAASSSSSSSASSSFLAPVDNSSFPDTWLEYAYRSSRRNQGPHGDREIIRFNCCRHCLGVLTENLGVDPSPCVYCQCSLCGWAPVDILRIQTSRPDCNGKAVYYVPLGIMRDREKAVPVSERLRKWTSHLTYSSNRE
ncbi:hypothetical protein MPDQ_001092 [Monascus purpureus]|uniref:F-box domain-containing protein n=1 Tax=Monascus purpureus TaxID=5098 RepID=A0A507QQP9_MONPU|nr:hypothetical protein MPDQ_001092 [Monascus purpureus]BDD58152.1 hypothetical protein MAP00_003453 [Monascus purpureus]